jgi:hypothetical protein
MSNTAELCARLLEHAAIHDRETSPYSPEQAAWAADLRDAAALIQAAPVVERADSATPVVERGAGNLSDNAAPVAHAEPASEPAPAPRLRWAEAPRRTEWGAGMMEALIALGVDETLRLYAHRDAVPMVDALLPAQPAPALVPLTDEQAESLIENSDGRWHDGEFRIDGPDLMKLLRDAAQPAPARVPLTAAPTAQQEPKP